LRVFSVRSGQCFPPNLSQSPAGKIPDAEIDNCHGKCHADGMKTTVTVDDFGRLVLPKSIREALGVFGRTSVVIEMVGDKAEMAVTSPPSKELSRKGGRVVYAGPLPEDWNSGDAVRELRNKRSRRS